jgi:hypothetical protein
LLEVGEGAQLDALVLVYPAIGDVVDGDRVEEVELVATAAAGGDEICLLEDTKVLGDCLARHLDAFTELREGLPVFGEEPVEKQASAGICEGSEDEVGIVHEEDIMQPFGCMSSGRPKRLTVRGGSTREGFYYLDYKKDVPCRNSAQSGEHHAYSDRRAGTAGASAPSKKLRSNRSPPLPVTASPVFQRFMNESLSSVY